MGGQLCIECGRDDFKSSKALHGHLRRHPERNYRGINPTSRRNFVRQKRKDMGSGGGASGTTTLSSPAVQEPDFVKPLSWYPPDQIPPPVKKLCSKTHNRRYPSDASNTYNLSILATASSSLSAMPKDLQVNPPPRPHTSHDMSPRPTAISIGRNLAKVDPNSLSQAADSQSDEPDTNSSSEAAMQEPFLHIDSHPSDKTVIGSTHNLSLEANLKEGDGPGTTSSFTVEESMEEDLKRKRTIEDELICGVQNQIHNKRGSSCNICSKSFDSYQALGGHMTSHIDKSKAIGSESGKATEHPCNICGDIYPTGQALGGHKRKHWKAPQIETLPQPATQPQPENKLPGFMFFGAWFSASP